MTPQELFLRGVWALIPREDDVSWVHNVSQLPLTDRPLGDYGDIVRRMLAAGVPAQDIARLARIIGYETAHGLLYHLDDPNASYEGFPEEERQLYWSGLQAIDSESDEPVEPLNGLYENLLSMDPNGREMRPPRRK